MGKQAEKYVEYSEHCISAAAREEGLSVATLLEFGRRAWKVREVSGMERGVSQNSAGQQSPKNYFVFVRYR